MKGKTSKIVLVLASLFFGVFFFFNDAFATVNWSQYGVEIVGLGFEENTGDLFLEFAYNNSVDGEWGDGTEVVCIAGSDGFNFFPYGYINQTSFPGGIEKINTPEIVGGENCFNALYDVGSGGTDAICTGLGGSCKIKYTKMWGAYNYLFDTSGYIDKNEIDNIAGQDVFENAVSSIGFVYNYYDHTYSWQDFHVGYYQSNYESIPIYFGAAASMESYIENSNGFPISSVPPLVDGACGTVDGSTFNYADFNTQDWCSAGDFSFYGTANNGNMLYSCVGTGGGTTDNCSASYYINGDCGTLNGTTQASIGIENENLCSYNYLLDETSFSTTATGWSWICNGLYGGYDSFCTAEKSNVVFPDIPETEDCSTYTFPNNWICNINKTITSAFLPSAEKINELNLSINAIQQKAPFNYLNIAKTKITELTHNISQAGLSMSILGNTSTINENALTTLADNVKKFFTFILMLAFLFWGINYIKHFFK